MNLLGPNILDLTHVLVPDVTIINQAVTLALATGGLQSACKRVSLLVCTYPSNGKTAWIMKRFYGNPGTHVFDYFTRVGWDQWRRADTNAVKCHHLFVPDMTPMLEGSKASIQANLSFMQTLIYDGVSDMRSLHMAGVHTTQPIHQGIIAGITPSAYHDWTPRWLRTGFRRRWLVLSYDYTAEQKNGIGIVAAEGRNTSPPRIALETELWGQHVYVPAGLMQQLREVAKDIITRLGTPPELYEHHVIVEPLRNMVMANAQQQGRLETTQKDVDTVLAFAPFLDHTMKRLLPNTWVDLSSPPSVNGHRPNSTLEGSNVH